MFKSNQKLENKSIKVLMDVFIFNESIYIYIYTHTYIYKFNSEDYYIETRVFFLVGVSQNYNSEEELENNWW